MNNGLGWVHTFPLHKFAQHVQPQEQHLALPRPEGFIDHAQGAAVAGIATTRRADHGFLFVGSMMRLVDGDGWMMGYFGVWLWLLVVISVWRFLGEREIYYASVCGCVVYISTCFPKGNSTFAR